MTSSLALLRALGDAPGREQVGRRQLVVALRRGQRQLLGPGGERRVLRRRFGPAGRRRTLAGRRSHHGQLADQDLGPRRGRGRARAARRRRGSADRRRAGACAAASASVVDLAEDRRPAEEPGTAVRAAAAAIWLTGVAVTTSRPKTSQQQQQRHRHPGRHRALQQVADGAAEQPAGVVPLGVRRPGPVRGAAAPAVATSIDDQPTRPRPRCSGSPGSRISRTAPISSSNGSTSGDRADEEADPVGETSARAGRRRRTRPRLR